MTPRDLLERLRSAGVLDAAIQQAANLIRSERAAAANRRLAQPWTCPECSRTWRTKREAARAKVEERQACCRKHATIPAIPA